MAAADPYRDFIEAKIVAAPELGLRCALDDVRTHRLDGAPGEVSAGMSAFMPIADAASPVGMLPLEMIREARAMIADLAHCHGQPPQDVVSACALAAIIDADIAGEPGRAVEIGQSVVSFILGALRASS